MRSTATLRRRLVAAVAFATALAPARLAADGEYLIEDLGQARGDSFTEYERFDDHAVLDGIAYFYRDDGRHGLELWRSDGTALGTYLLRDVCPGICGADGWWDAFPIERVGQVVHFVASDGVHGRELWVTDGTSAGTRMVADVLPGPRSSEPDSLTSGSGRSYFIADDGSQRRRIWVSDGTSTGTRLLMPVEVDPIDSTPLSVVRVGSLLYVLVHRASTGYGLWRSDGTPAGTFEVHATTSTGSYFGIPGRVAELADASIVFSGCSIGSGFDDCEPWRSDGTPAGTVRIADLRPGTGSSNAGGFRRVGNEVWFTADHPSTGRRTLYRTDGSESGTQMLPLPAGLDAESGLTKSAPLGSGLVFVGCDDVSGCEPWFTDGVGASPLGDLAPGPESSVSMFFSGQPRFTTVGDQLLFLAGDETGASALWRTDGTSAGTALVSELDGRPSSGGGPFFGQASFVPSITTGTDWILPIFRADRGLEVWSSDGTTAGTSSIVTLMEEASSFFAPIQGMYSPGQHRCSAPLRQGLVTKVVDLEGSWKAHLVFSDGVPGGVEWIRQVDEFDFGRFVECEPNGPDVLATGQGSTLWRTSGFAASTQALIGGAESLYSGPTFERHRDDLVLQGSLQAGTPRGLIVVPRGATAPEDVVAIPSPLPGDLLASTGELLFQIDAAGGLAVTDGQAEPSVLIESSPAAGYRLAYFDRATTNGWLFFVRDTLEEGPELWRSDGSIEGTGPVRNLIPGPEGGIARRPQHAIWNRPLENRIVVAGEGRIVFVGDDGTTGDELWTSDGTEQGTVLVADIAPGPDASWPRHLVSLGNGIVLFAAEHPKLGYELFRTDGTATGTSMVRDLVVGPGSSVPDDFVVQDGVLYFSAWTREHGREAWRSDGTFAGTYRLTDVAPGPLSSSPSRFVRRGNRLFFTATDHVHGFELWARADDGSVPIFIDGFETENTSRWSAAEP